MSHASSESAETPKPRRGVMGLVKVIAFVSVLVIVQVVAASFLIPSGKETEQLARDLVQAKHAAAEESEHAAPTEHNEHGDHEHDEEHGEGHGEHSASAEVELGNFTVTRYNAETDRTLNMDVTIFGVVLADESEEFAHVYETSKNRIGDQVVATLRSASASDLAEAGLGLLKRQILEKTNRALGKPLLQEVLITKCNYIEQ
jgi:flagellar basal body-associated protein FliL